MVNAQKHKEWLQDTPTRINKRLNKIFCLSNNAKKKDIKADKVLLAKCGSVGKDEVIRCNNKRNDIKRDIKRQLMEA